MNAAPATGPDGTIYLIGRAHFNSAYGYLVAVNPDLTPLWSASLRDRLNDGCDVLLPPSGSLGGCRAGSFRGVDPATNELPAGRVFDQSTSSPVVAPDGSILYGAATRYNYGRGHLFRFSSTGGFLAAYDFGWDITPAVYEHDGTWSVILKDNFYPVGTYCGVPGQCGEGEAKYSLTSLDSNLRRTGAMVGRVFLKLALGAAYTPLAIGGDGLVYTQNDGTLFVIGDATASPR